MKNSLLVAVAAAMLLAGCELPSVVTGERLAELEKKAAQVDKASEDLKVSQKAVKTARDERDNLKGLLEQAKQNAGISPAVCQARIDEMLQARPKCEAKPPRVITEPKPRQPQKPRQAPSSAPTHPPQVAQPAINEGFRRKPGGCIYTSDGTAILKGETTPKPNGFVIARQSDESIASEFAAMLKGHPKAFVTDEGHKAMCLAWSHLMAEKYQSPEGRKVNADTHRVGG